MALKIRNGDGTWRDASFVRIRNSDGTWRSASFVRKRNASGGWDTVWSASVTASPATFDKTGVRGNTLSQVVTLSKACTAAWLSGGAGISISGSGTSFTVSSTTAAGAGDVTRSGTIRFTATDGTGQTCDVPCSFFFMGSA